MNKRLTSEQLVQSACGGPVTLVALRHRQVRILLPALELLPFLSPHPWLLLRLRRS
jgi:hypothetical protein